MTMPEAEAEDDHEPGRPERRRDTVELESRNSPTAMIAVPAIGNGR